MFKRNPFGNDAWKDYFSFNKKQRNGILVLLSLIALLLIYLFIADYFPVSTKPIDFSPFKAELAKTGIAPSAIREKNKVIIYVINPIIFRIFAPSKKTI